MTDAELRDLVRDTQRVWGDPASAEWEGDELLVRAPDGRSVGVSRPPPIFPARWFFRNGDLKSSCLSTAVLLSLLLSTVGPAQGGPGMLVGTPNG